MAFLPRISPLLHESLVASLYRPGRVTELKRDLMQVHWLLAVRV